MAKINVTQGTAGAYGAGELQLKDKASMSATLTTVTDNLNTDSQLKLATNLTQVAGTLQIHTDTATYLDAEDASGNNRFTISRDPASQLVTVDFASVPTALTTPVGAIRTATNGSALANVMTFLENGNIGAGTDTPGAKLDVHSAVNVIAQFNRTGAGKSWIQYLLAGAAKWNTGFDNVNGNFTIYDAIAAADRMVVTNAGKVGIGTSTPTGLWSGDNRSLNILSPANNSSEVVMSRSSGSVAAASVSNFLSGTTDKFGLYTNDALNFSVYTNSLERMTITSAGNVGIGTTAPQQKLQIGGSGGTLAGTAAISFTDNNSGSSRNWVIANGASASGIDQIGALTISRSNALGGDALAAGTEIARFSANGLSFNGDTAAANALDDYEEGNWTATLTPSTSGSISLTDSLCTYTKIGNQVTVKSKLVISTVSVPVGTLIFIGGLPFPTQNTQSSRGSFSVCVLDASLGYIASTYPTQHAANSTNLIFYQNAATIDASDEILFTATYFV